MILSIAAALAASLAALFGGVDAPSAGVRTVESSHRIEFPERIVFDLDARGADIRSARLVYRVGSNRASVYSYPVSSRPTAAGFRARFEIRASGARFLPQGVDIEYYYALTASDGSETETERFALQYLDPRYRWRSADFDDFTILWHDRRDEDVFRVASDASSRLARAKELFGLDGEYRFKAVIVNGRAEANRSFPAVSAASRDAFLYGGFAFGDYGALVLAGLYADGLTHELVHLMLDEAVDSPRARVPAWLNEGLAMSFERGSPVGSVDLRRALRRGSLIPLSRMNAVPGRPNDVRLFYAQSASAVRYMLNAYGGDRMRALLARINAGDSIRDAVQSAYGMSLNALESRWRANLAGYRADADSQPPPSASRSPAVVASAALGGAALAIGATAAAIRWAKKRSA